MGYLKKTTTSNYKECLFKTLLFTSTITVELLLGYTAINSEFTAFYLTVLVQAVNNFYDAANCLDTENSTIFCIVRTSIVMTASVCAFVMSICYIASKENMVMRLFLSDNKAIYVVVTLLVSMIVSLIVELVIHFFEMMDSKSNKGDQSKKTLQISTENSKEVISLYNHGQNDILLNMPNRDS